MNLKNLLFTALLSFTIGQSYSQQIVPCLYDHGLNLIEATDNGYKERLFRLIESVSDKNPNRNEEIFKVKVVFHVVYNDEVENVSEEALNNQIRVLNECYRRTNADTVNLRPIFRPVAGDAGIEFEIDEIRRVKTTTTFRPSLTGLPDHVKETSKGGSDVKDPNRYLNIWVCKVLPIEFFGISSPVLGYAYPPDSLSHWPEGSSAPGKNLEGVVIDYRTVADSIYAIPSLGEIPMLGRTAVHEVGHYFGLRHISGDAGLFGVNCEGTDGVDDTPTQGTQSQFNCDHNQNTCGAGESGDLPDMIENYMDYSSETCQNTFTKGQVAIMRGVIQTLRKGLITTSTSTQTIALADEISIIPNPADQHFYITGMNESKSNMIFVYDMMGKLTLSQNAYNHDKIDISGLNPGIYLVQVNGVQTKKLVVTK